MKKTPGHKKNSPKSFTTILLVILVLLALAKGAPTALEFFVVKSLEGTVGAAVKIDRIQIDFLRSQFSLKGVRVSNPAGFPKGEMAILDRVSGRYTLPPVPGMAPGVKKLEVEFLEFRLLKNEKGILNLPALNPFARPGAAIEELLLTLSPVTFTDLSKEPPSQENYDLGLKQSVYRNVKGVWGIIEILNWEILKRTGIEEAPVAEAPATPTDESQAADQTLPGPALPALPESTQ
ncbi:MAG: hypothetical protein HYU34_04105 [Candidatus Omnitrophica bacterium]|nr:hypothetical protein [Candidatus Omnitrophota bacterium]